MIDRVARVLDLTVIDDTHLALTFADGTAGVADLEPHMTADLALLRDPSVFRAARVRGGSVEWTNDVDVDAEWLYALAHGLQPPVTSDDVDRNHLEVTLRELRKLAGKTQEETAGAAGMAQSEVSRIEGQRDALVTTLRRYVEALGGELKLVARFGNHTMKLSGIG